jgi:hypothetical protein
MSFGRTVEMGSWMKIAARDEIGCRRQHVYIRRGKGLVAMQKLV